MAHSYLSMTASTALRPILARAKSMARLPTAVNGLNFLGSDTTERDNQIVYIANDIQRQLLDRFPILSITSTTQNTAVTTFNLPSGLRATDIVMAAWNDDETEIDVVTQAELLLLGDRVVAYGATDPRPSYIVLQWAQSGGNGQARWYPAPSGVTKTATIYYRARPTAFSITDLINDVVTSVIPDEMIDMYAMAIAAELQKRCLGRTHAETQSLAAESEATISQWQYMLAKTLSQRMQESIGRSKLLSTAANPPAHDFWGLLRNMFTETNPPKQQA
jgi:hypothetical protein